MNLELPNLTPDEIKAGWERVLEMDLAHLPTNEQQDFANVCAMLRGAGKPPPSGPPCSHATSHFAQFGQWLEANGLPREYAAFVPPPEEQ